MIEFEGRTSLPEGVEAAIVATRKRLAGLGSNDFLDPALAAPAMELLNRGGKLFRPAILFMGALAVGEEPINYIDLAVAVELLHSSSLMHDDVIDEDERRRGDATVHEKYGEHAAVIAGDALISKAVQQACNYGAPVVEYVSKAAMEMCAGEMVDYRCQRECTIPSIGQYLRIIELKSASLIGASAAAPAIHKKSPHAASLESFGRGVGMAFQIRDDIIDWLGIDVSDSLPSTTDRIAFRPNIISSLTNGGGKTEREAVSEAVSLNNRYISEAVMRAEEVGAADLAAYASIVRLDIREVLAGYRGKAP